MANIITKLTHDAMLKFGIKDKKDASFTMKMHKVSTDKLNEGRNASYSYLI